MPNSLLFYTNSALTILPDAETIPINHNIDGTGDPQDFLFYAGSTNSANKFQKASNPGVDAIVVDVVNATPVWLAATAYVVNDKRRTPTKNGYRYKVQSITGGGLSGGSAPTWPTVIGNTVVDNEVTWINDGKQHENTEIKLALSSGALTGATPGASLTLPVTINGGVAGAIPIYMRIDDATAMIGKIKELGLSIPGTVETPI